jgi:citrate synthase
LFDPAEIAGLADRSRPRRPAATAGFVIESAVTEISDGPLRYRGVDVVQLALWRPFEDVAEWLWSGSSRPSPSSRSARQDGAPWWQATAEAVAAGRGAQAALPAGTLPLERLRVIVPAMAATDRLRLHLDPPAVIAAGRSIIAGMIDCLPSAAPGTPAFPPAAPAPAPGQAPGPGPGPASVAASALGQGGLAGRLWYRICGRRPDPGLLGALRAALALLADHELASSTFAARVAASVRADPYAVVSTGLGALGALGGGSLGAEAMLALVREPADAARVVGDQLRRGSPLSGFGGFGDGVADPRATLLLDLIGKAAPRSARYAAAMAVLTEVRRGALPEPNIDFALAVLVSVADMIPGAGEAIFAVARTAGWIAHALEEYARDLPLRPRTVYTGPLSAAAPAR